MNSELFLPGGSEYITRLISEAVSRGERTATVSGRYIIDAAVHIPSDFTLVLEECHLKMADGCYSNMFVNEHHDTDIGRTAAGADRKISIIGRGEAVLDGGEYNGLSERNYGRDGMPPIWKNNLILFTNVDEFRIEGLSCRNQRWWAICFIFSSNGYIGNIDFCSCDTAISADGEVYHGLIRERYDEVLVKNADGIDLRRGCHDIVIENISGFTEDDTVALTALYGDLERHFEVEGASPDICNVRISNVRSSAFCTIVRLLNQGNVKLHDVIIEDIYDTADETDYFDKGLYAVRIGDTRMYGERHATADETYNISLNRISGCSTYAVALAGNIGGLTMSDIECRGDCLLLLDERL